MNPLSEITLPVIVGAALVDSLNPCAFALLLVFVATTLSLLQQQGDPAKIASARRWLLLRGGVYILGIFVTYLILGLGLFGMIQYSKLLGSTHYVSQIAALVAIGLGLLALQEALLPEWGSRLGAHIERSRLRSLVSKLSMPALFGAGILVGLCTVPCSGSVYLAVLALLSTQTTWLSGVGYLVLYNLVFVAPLLLLLALASSKPVYRQLARWQLHQRALLKFGTSAAAIAVGLLTLILV